MFIRSDVGSTHDHHHQHNLANDNSITAATAATKMVTKVNRDSHTIKKSSTSLNTSPPLTPKNRTHPRQPQPPLIIYAHAPRVIHTKPEEFKALVQTLTGYTGNKNSTGTTTATKNDLPSPSPPPTPTPLLPPPNKIPMYYDFEEFETKNVVPLINNNLFSINDDLKHKTSLIEENLNISGDGGCNFAAPILDPPLMHQINRTSVPFFTPSYGDQFCCTNNNNSVGFVGKMNNNNNNNFNNNNQMLYDQNYVAAETGSGSGCYYSDGLSSSLDLSSSLSSMEEAIDRLTDFC